MRPLCGVDFVGGDIPQRENDVNAAKDQHAVVDFDLALRNGSQLSPAGANLTRFQRASQRAEQSPAGRSDNVVDGCRVRVRNIAGDAVMPRDRAMRSEANRLCFGRHLREAQRSFHAGDRNLGAINDVAHISSVRLKPDSPSVIAGTAIDQ